MKEKLTRNLGLKILSVILAAVLWLVITNVDDPEEAKRFSDMKVQVLNEDAITSLDQVYVITKNDTVNFTVQARRTIKQRLTRSDFVVTADLSNLSVTDSVPIEITCPRYGDEVTIIDGKYQFMKISLQKIDTRSFKVDINQKGTAADNYYVGETTASPNIIQVTGPQARVERIDKVVVDVNVTGMSESDVITATPKALDADGNEIDTSDLTFSEEQVDVKVTIYNTKTIRLQITATGEPAYGYSMTKIDFEPKEVTIAGDDESLKRITFLPITESVSGATENIEKQINLQELLPDGLVVVGEDNTAVINITIEKMETKELSVYPNNIGSRNKPDDLDLSIDTPGPINIKIMGLKSDVDVMSVLSIKPYLELAGYTAGTYSKSLDVDQSNKVTLLDSPPVLFTLKERTGSE